MIELENIELWIYDLFKGIGEDTYLGKVPKAVPERKQDYVLISFNGRIQNFGAYKSLSITINAVARDKQPGIMDATRISEMTKAILTKIPATTDNYSIISPSVLPMRGITGFSYVSITTELRIKN